MVLEWRMEKLVNTNEYFGHDVSEIVDILSIRGYSKL
jgi:hypothetical protein